MDDLFSTRKPKNFKAGVSSGLKSMGKGLATGVAGLVAAPIIGAKEEGFKGAAKGVAAGVVGAVVLPVTGVAVGTGQSAACLCLQMCSSLLPHPTTFLRALHSPQQSAYMQWFAEH